MTHSTIRQCRNPSGLGTVRRVGPGPKGRSDPGFEPRRLYPFLNRTASSQPLVALPALEECPGGHGRTHQGPQSARGMTSTPTNDVSTPSQGDRGATRQEASPARRGSRRSGRLQGRSDCAGRCARGFNTSQSRHPARRALTRGRLEAIGMHPHPGERSSAGMLCRREARASGEKESRVGS